MRACREEKGEEELRGEHGLSNPASSALLELYDMALHRLSPGLALQSLAFVCVDSVTVASCCAAARRVASHWQVGPCGGAGRGGRATASLVLAVLQTQGSLAAQGLKGMVI